MSGQKELAELLQAIEERYQTHRRCIHCGRTPAGCTHKLNATEGDEFCCKQCEHGDTPRHDFYAQELAALA